MPKLLLSNKHKIYLNNSTISLINLSSGANDVRNTLRCHNSANVEGNLARNILTSPVTNYLEIYSEL